MTGGRGFDDVAVGDALPVVRDTISYTRVVMNAGATMDYYPGHHDPEFARGDGHRTIFVNTMHVAGFIDRVVGEWAGPRSRVVRRKMSVRKSIFAGDTMVGAGTVTGKYVDDATGRRLVEIGVEVTDQDGNSCAPAQVTVLMLD